MNVHKSVILAGEARYPFSHTQSDSRFKSNLPLEKISQEEVEHVVVSQCSPRSADHKALGCHSNDLEFVCSNERTSGLKIVS